MAAKPRKEKTVVRSKAPSSQGRSWLRALQRAMAIAGVIVMAGVTGVFVTYLMSLPVEEIVIRGDLKHVKRDDISVIIEPRVERGFLRTDIQRISDDLERLAWIERADVRRRWPGTVLVIVSEEQPIARWGRSATSTLVAIFSTATCSPSISKCPSSGVTGDRRALWLSAINSSRPF